MTQPARGYQQYQPMAPMMSAPTPPRQSRGGLTTLLAGVLALVVAGLAVGSTFASITDYRNSYEIDDEPSVYATSTTWWGFHDAGSSSPVEEESILAGLTLVLAGTLLLLGAVFAFVASRTRKPGPVAGGRSLISAGVGVLAGVTLLQLLAVLRQMETYNEQELDAGESLEFTAGLGLWLPLGGIVLGIVAVVLAHVGQRQTRVEPNTPRMGFPAPYGYRPQPPERVTEVHISDEDAAADTQVVSGATVSGADASEQLTSPSVGSGAQAPAGGSAGAPAGAPGSASGAGTPAAGAPAAGAPATAAAAASAQAAPVTPPAPIAPPAPAAAPAGSSASPAAAPQAESPAPPAAPTAAAAPQAESPAPQAEPAAPKSESTAPAAAPQADAAPADATPAAPTAPPATPPADAAPAAEPSATPAEAPDKPEADKPEADKPEAAKPTPLSELPAAPPAPEPSSPDDKTK